MQLDERKQDDDLPRHHETRYLISKPTWVTSVTFTIHDRKAPDAPGVDGLVQLSHFGFLV